MKKKCFFSVLCVCLLLAFVGCSMNDGTDTSDDMKNAADNVKNEENNMVNDMKDAADEAGDDVKDMMDGQTSPGAIDDAESER